MMTASGRYPPPLVAALPHLKQAYIYFIGEVKLRSQVWLCHRLQAHKRVAQGAPLSGRPGEVIVPNPKWSCNRKASGLPTDIVGRPELQARQNAQRRELSRRGGARWAVSENPQGRRKAARPGLQTGDDSGGGGIMEARGKKLSLTVPRCTGRLDRTNP